MGSASWSTRLKGGLGLDLRGNEFVQVWYGDSEVICTWHGRGPRGTEIQGRKHEIVQCKVSRKLSSFKGSEVTGSYIEYPETNHN